MKVIITGGGGFLGNQLARALLKRGALTGPSGRQTEIDEVLLFDQFISEAARAGLEEKVTFVEGDIADAEIVNALIDREDLSVFHLASMVSGECEVQFDQAMDVNLDGCRHLLEALRDPEVRPRFVFASSVAAFGGASMPRVVSDYSKRAPQTTYGMTKVISELLVNDYSRKGFIDGRGARLPTVIIRPGKPNTAASSFASGMFREPLAGQPCAMPVDRSQKMPIVGYRTVVQYFIELHELPTNKLDDDRIFTLPSVDWSVERMVDTLEGVAARFGIELGPIIDEPDPVIRRIVDTWPTATDASRALNLGLPPVDPLRVIIQQYLEDFGPRIFEVDTFRHVSGGQVIVQGNCAAGGIEVGDHFSAQILRQQNHERLQLEGVDIEQVKLKVREIRGQNNGSLSAGEAGVLLLETESPVELQASALLRG